MSELVEALIGESYAARPAHVLDRLSAEQAATRVAGSPRTIYDEVWHLLFWQQMTLDWVRGVETPYPERPEDAFPGEAQRVAEPWDALRQQFLAALEQTAEMAHDTAGLGRMVRCTSRPGQPVRTMSVGDQLLSSAAHNAYHLGRVVLLRQMIGAWPPAGGGFTW
jgi:uncharacterized damage-inducible protein DinB